MPGGTSINLDMHVIPHTRIEALVQVLYPGTEVASAVTQIMHEVNRGRVKVATHDIPRPPPIGRNSEDKKGSSIEAETISLLNAAMRGEWKSYSRKYGITENLGPFATLYIENALLSKRDREEAIEEVIREMRKGLTSKSAKDLVLRVGPKLGI